ncbi:MAG TPA: elongation factor P [Acidimicrobiia bacterium]|jgi:elongation factor P|nr:elongation factor P [Acidimicrobiia bacterium]
MISTNDVKPGMALNLDDGLYSVVEYQHVKPGKGKAFVRMKLKSLDSGAVVDRTFRAGENVPRAMINRQDFQYLYKDDLGFHCMNTETYEQMSVPADLVGDVANYLVEGMTVQLNLFEGNPIGIDLPASVELEVSYAEPGVKGDRVSGATKPVTLQTGLVVQAPLFIEQGDVVKVDTRTGDYITRVS